METEEDENNRWGMRAGEISEHLKKGRERERGGKKHNCSHNYILRECVVHVRFHRLLGTGKTCKQVRL